MEGKFFRKLKLVLMANPKVRALEAKFARGLNKSRKIAAGLLIITLISQMFSFSAPLFSSGPRDYDDNGIIWGGAYSVNELLSKIENGDSKNTDIKHIFQTIGIFEPDIKSASLTDGYVYKDGTVKVGSKVVASNVLSGGRKYLSGSVKDPDLPIYWRSPSVSFNSNSISAFVYLHNSQFVWAILKSCGNPIVKQTRIKPKLVVKKEVKKEGDSKWYDKIEAQPGDTIAYLISWTNTSSITALSTYVRDSLPPYVSAVAGSAKLYDSLHPNGVSVDVNALIKGGLNVGNTLPDGKPHYIRFQAKISSNLPAGTHRLINVGAVRAFCVPEVWDEAEMVVKVAVQILPGKIIGVKFNDLNGNGKKDASEPGISGVTIKLLKDSQVLKTAITDKDGDYSFGNLAPSTYTVEEIVPSGWENTTPVSVKAIIESGKTIRVDFGNKKIVIPPQKAQIHGLKFNDLNGNQKWDENEPGISGVVIELYKKISSSKELLSKTTTDQNGQFHFINLDAGSYIVEEVVPENWKATTPTSVDLELKPGDNKIIYFGNQKIVIQIPLAQIHGLKFNDLNGNGKWEEGEPGLKGVTINLYKLKETLGVTVEKTLIASTTTDKNGQFHFLNLEPGTYIVEEVIPDGFEATTKTSIKVTLKEGDNISVVFGNIEKKIIPPAPVKPIPTLPKTGAPITAVFTTFLIFSSLYLYFRERFLLKLVLLQI